MRSENQKESSEIKRHFKSNWNKAKLKEPNDRREFLALKCDTVSTPQTRTVIWRKHFDQISTSEKLAEAKLRLAEQ